MLMSNTIVVEWAHGFHLFLAAVELVGLQAFLEASRNSQVPRESIGGLTEIFWMKKAKRPSKNPIMK